MAVVSNEFFRFNDSRLLTTGKERRPHHPHLSHPKTKPRNLQAPRPSSRQQAHALLAPYASLSLYLQCGGSLLTTSLGATTLPRTQKHEHFSSWGGVYLRSSTLDTSGWGPRKRHEMDATTLKAFKKISDLHHWRIKSGDSYSIDHFTYASTWMKMASRLSMPNGLQMSSGWFHLSILLEREITQRASSTLRLRK